MMVFSTLASGNKNYSWSCVSAGCCSRSFSGTLFLAWVGAPHVGTDSYSADDPRGDRLKISRVLCAAVSSLVLGPESWSCLGFPGLLLCLLNEDFGLCPGSSPCAIAYWNKHMAGFLCAFLICQGSHSCCLISSVLPTFVSYVLSLLDCFRQEGRSNLHYSTLTRSVIRVQALLASF